jgi:hypothetical protein
MTIEELDKLQEELETKIKKLKAELERMKNPSKILHEIKLDEDFYFIDGENKSFKDIIGYQPNLKDYGDFITFDSEEKAEYYIKLMEPIRRLAQIATELNEGWEPDWSDKRQKKYYIIHIPNEFRCEVDLVLETKRSSIYFKSKELAQKAIKEIQRLRLWENTELTE